MGFKKIPRLYFADIAFFNSPDRNRAIKRMGVVYHMSPD